MTIKNAKAKEKPKFMILKEEINDLLIKQKKSYQKNKSKLDKMTPLKYKNTIKKQNSKFLDEAKNIYNSLNYNFDKTNIKEVDKRFYKIIPEEKKEEPKAKEKPKPKVKIVVSKPKPKPKPKIVESKPKPKPKENPKEKPKPKVKRKLKIRDNSIKKDGSNIGNIPNKKLKCWMIKVPNRGMYRTCATPAKDLKPKKQVRGKPRINGKGGEKLTPLVKKKPKKKLLIVD